jgi:hypothetical protein
VYPPTPARVAGAMRRSIVAALVASTIDTSNNMIGSQRVVDRSWLATQPTRLLFSQYLLSDPTMVGTEAALRRRATGSFVRALVHAATGARRGLAAVQARTQRCH